MEQFELYSVPFLGLALPNVILFLIVAAAIPLLIAKMASSRPLAGSWWTTLNESLYATILRMVEENVGPKAAVHFPLLFVVFHLVLFGNLIGLAPYPATPTAELVLTLAAAFALLVGALIGGIIAHGPRLLALYLPAGTPLGLIPLMVLLELLAFVTRTLSLGLRLGVNLITGHILVKVMTGFVWGFLESGSMLGLIVGFALVAAFVGLEVLICYLQALIFTFITLITLKEMAAGPCSSAAQSIDLAWISSPAVSPS